MERHAHASLAQCLPERVAKEPDRTAYIFLRTEEAEQHVSYRQLYADALIYARTLAQAGVQSGDLVLLVFDHGYEIIAAFWGAIHLGAVPAVFPYFVSDPTPEVYQRSLFDLREFAGAKVVLTLAEFAPALSTWVTGTGCLVCSKTSTTETKGDEISPSVRQGEDLAYVQLTTGSTGTSKGAMISHRSLFHRTKTISSAFGIQDGDVCVGWWPFNQAAGLRDAVIAPVVVGYTTVNIPPQYWVRHPELLLQAIHRFRGVASMMPNSGLSHCARNIREQDLIDVDLRSWRVLGIGGETVQPESLRLFAERFAPYGFSATVLRPYYASAECGHIAAPHVGDQLQVDWILQTDLDSYQRATPTLPSTEGVKTVVSCGYPTTGVEVRIVDDGGDFLPERSVGEILVRSPGLFSGYSCRPDLTAQMLRDGWFSTGDLGYLADGQLYLCDRKKDVIITGGKNLYAVDLEITAKGILGEHGGNAVAFGVPDAGLGTELPVLVAEVESALNDVERTQFIRSIRQQVFQGHGVALTDVRLVDLGWVVKVPKLSRAANRQKYLACGFLPAASLMSHSVLEPLEVEAEPKMFSQDDLKRIVTELFINALGIPTIGQDESFFDLGGDSLVFVNLLASLENRLGRVVPVEELAERPTIADMVKALDATSSHLPPQEPVLYERLTPIPVMRQVLFAADLSAAEKWRRVRELLRIRFTDTGPRFFGHTLPYAVGAPMLEWLCRQTGMMQKLFIKRVKLLDELLGAAKSLVSREEAFEQHMRTHLWMHWRVAALAQCARAEFARWVPMHGLDAFQRALQQGRGVVLPLSHLGPYLFFMLVLRQLGIEDFLIVGAQPPYGPVLDLFGFGNLKERHHFSVTHRDRRRASQLLTAQHVLQRGGVVLITGDGYQGKLPFLLPFCGRQRSFGVGFAELAAQTGAAVVPLFHRVAQGGRLAVAFLEPLSASAETHQEKVAQWVRQYVALLEQRWLQDPGSVRFYQLEWFLYPAMAARSNALLAETAVYRERTFAEEL